MRRGNDWTFIFEWTVHLRHFSTCICVCERERDERKAPGWPQLLRNTPLQQQTGVEFPARSVGSHRSRNGCSSSVHLQSEHQCTARMIHCLLLMEMCNYRDYRISTEIGLSLGVCVCVCEGSLITFATHKHISHGISFFFCDSSLFALHLISFASKETQLRH